MAVIFPYELLPWVEMRWLDADGAPLIGGKIWTYSAGTSDPLATFTDVDGLVPHTNPIILDAAARPPSPIFLQPTGYKLLVMDANDVEQYSVDDVETVGAAFAANLGIVLGEGSKNTNSGYVVLESDRLVTVDSTGGPDPAVVTLLPVADATQPVTIKNTGSIEVVITASGTDKVDLNASTFTLPAGTASNLPTVTLVPYPPSDWFITSSHGL